MILSVGTFCVVFPQSLRSHIIGISNSQTLVKYLIVAFCSLILLRDFDISEAFKLGNMSPREDYSALFEKMKSESENKMGRYRLFLKPQIEYEVLSSLGSNCNLNIYLSI